MQAGAQTATTFVTSGTASLSLRSTPIWSVIRAPGQHEHAPQRVLPFFPVFIAAMNLVVIADDAYTFLFAWELMSLASWALVIAHHRAVETVQAGYVYLLMAALSGFALLQAS